MARWPRLAPAQSGAGVNAAAERVLLLWPAARSKVLKRTSAGGRHHPKAGTFRTWRCWRCGARAASRPGPRCRPAAARTCAAARRPPCLSPAVSWRAAPGQGHRVLSCSPGPQQRSSRGATCAVLSPRARRRPRPLAPAAAACPPPARPAPPAPCSAAARRGSHTRDGAAHGAALSTTRKQPDANRPWPLATVVPHPRRPPPSSSTAAGRCTVQPCPAATRRNAPSRALSTCRASRSAWRPRRRPPWACARRTRPGRSSGTPAAPRRCARTRQSRSACMPPRRRAQQMRQWPPFAGTLRFLVQTIWLLREQPLEDAPAFRPR